MNSRNQVISGLAYNVIFLCAAGAAPSSKLSAQEPGSILEAVRQGVESAASLSASRVEFEFFEFVEKQASETDAIGSFHDGLANWLLDDVQFGPKDKLRLRTCVYMFHGTDDSAGPYEEMTVHNQELDSAKSSTLIVTLRVRDTVPFPLVRIAAVVEIDKGAEVVLYTTKKLFQYDGGRWKLLASTPESGKP